MRIFRSQWQIDMPIIQVGESEGFAGRYGLELGLRVNRKTGEMQKREVRWFENGDHWTWTEVETVEEYKRLLDEQKTCYLEFLKKQEESIDHHSLIVIEREKAKKELIH